MLAATNHVVTGTPNVNITNSTATATSVVPGVVTEAQSLNFIFSGGAYALTFLATASHAARSITFSEGWAGTWAATSTGVIYGSLSLSTTMTLTISASAMTFGGTSGTKTITTASKTIPFPLTFNGVGSTFQLIGALTTSAAVTLTNGTFDGNSQTISGVTAFTMVTGTATIQNVSTALAFTLTSGTLNLGSACSFGAYTLTAGTLNLNNYVLTATNTSGCVKSDSVFVTSNSSDIKGNFLIALRTNQKYILKFSYLGYATTFKKIETTDKDVFLNKIIFKERNFIETMRIVSSTL
jgi:hypothetical protein